MSTLVIENIDEVLLDDLFRQAAHHHISVEQLAKRLLRQAISVADGEKRVDIADAIAAKTPKGVVRTDGVVILREDRDR